MKIVYLLLSPGSDPYSRIGKAMVNPKLSTIVVDNTKKAKRKIFVPTHL
jgi:hypothetical protein